MESYLFEFSKELDSFSMIMIKHNIIENYDISLHSLAYILLVHRVGPIDLSVIFE